MGNSKKNGMGAIQEIGGIAQNPQLAEKRSA
jgi:hypothetical protein